MKLFLVLLAIICLFAAGAMVLVWSGVYNIAANDPHWRITEWVLEETRERSIMVHSKGIEVRSQTDQRLLDIGFEHYNAMCLLCHNAPGYTRTEISRGLYPSPPDFGTIETELPGDAQLFWIAKNGIKMTGMPAFGSTHSEEELWGIVHFVRGLSNLKRDEYDVMVKAVTAHKGTGHHH